MNYRGPVKIFLVEDNFLISYLLDNELKEEYGDVSITTFTTGEECIEMLDNEPDLVILDHYLGMGLNGLETLKIIKKLNPDVPVIIFSSQPDPQVIRNFIIAGAADYIPKNDTFTALEKLKTSLQKVLKKK